MKKTYQITYPTNYLKGENKQITVIGTKAQAEAFAYTYGQKIGFYGQFFMREVA